MAEFDSKTAGRNRSSYSQCILKGKLDNEVAGYGCGEAETLWSYYRSKVDRYLSRVGSRLVVHEHRAYVDDLMNSPPGEMLGGWVEGQYHLDGATLRCEFRADGNTYDRSTDLYGDCDVTFHLASNAHLEDVANKLKKKYPFLQGPRPAPQRGWLRRH